MSSAIGNIGQAFDTYFTDHGLVGRPDASLDDALTDEFANFGADLFNQLKGAGISAVSSFLAGELGEAIGLDSGFEGQLFQVVTGRTIGTVLDTVTANIQAGTPDLFAGLNPGSLAQAGAGAVGSFIGSYLAREIVTAQSQAGAIGGSIGGAIGSTIGFGLAGVGFLGSTAIGSIGAGITAGLGTAFGISLGAIILPGVGAFIGTILGTLLGDLFDDLFGNSGYPKGTANISLDFESGLYYESGTNGANGGGDQLALVTSLAERSEAIINSYIELLGGENANSHSPTIQFYQVGPGSSSQGLHVTVQAPGGEADPNGPVHHTRLQPGEITGAAIDKAVEDAVLAAIKTVQTKGGDLYLKRAVHGSQADNLREFAGDLKIAEDYKTYLKDKAVIDALIAVQPDSAFAAGWLITLLRAEELGLTNWQDSDFYGGLEGLLMSLEVERTYGIGNDEVVVSVVTETLLDGSERSDLLLRAGDHASAATIARINGFETAVGINLLEGNSASGTAGKDLWFAASNGARFTDHATWSDEHSHDILIGNDGNDTIKGGLGWDFIHGGAGNDALYGGAHEDTIYGQEGNDRIVGDDQPHSGSAGGEFGTDPKSLQGADANDGSTREWFGFKPHPQEPLGHYNTVPVRTPYGADKLSGGKGNDTIIGVGGSDRIFGGAGNDKLYGGEDGSLINVNQTLHDGDDYIEGGSGADRIYGGEGYDTASYASSNAAVDVDLTRPGGQSGGHAAGDVLSGIEDILGSAFGDVLRGNADSNTFDGGLGDDHLNGRGGIDTVSYFSSEFGVEVNLASDASKPWLGRGKTIERSADGSTSLHETDTLVNFESVIGSRFDDIITGSIRGPGVLRGREGNDVFKVAFGDAQVVAGAAATTVLGGDGFDTLSFGGRTAGVTIDLSDDASSGNVYHSIEHLTGSSGHDVLTAAAAGGFVEGGEGDDKLFGGLEANTYVFNVGDGSDVIDDTTYLEPLAAEYVLHGGAFDDTVSFGDGIEFRHIVGQLRAVDRPDFLPENRSSREFEFGNAIDFSQAGFQLGVRTLNGSRDGYATSVAQLSDRIDITYGGLIEGVRFNDFHSRTKCRPVGGDGANENCITQVSSTTYEVQKNVGAIELLQFADSGHIVLGDVRHFVTGTASNDTSKAADDLASWIFTGAGNDHLTGSNQGDVLVGGTGQDLLYGAGGRDQYTYWLGDGHDIIDDTGGQDTLVFGGGITKSLLNVRVGSLGNGADPNTFRDAPDAGLGADLRIEVLDPDDQSSVAGSVTIRSYRVQDKVIERIRASGLDEAANVLANIAGSSGAAALSGLIEHSSSVELALSDILPSSLATAYDDVLTVKEGETRLSGNRGDDVLHGGDTDDVLEGGVGADEIDGSLGVDFASYENASAGIIVDLSSEKQQSRDSGAFEEEGDVLRNIEGIIGSDHDDTIKGNIHENILNGGGGNDHLTGDPANSGQPTGTSRDVFVFDGVHGSDVVYDFEIGRDVLEFHNVDANSLSVSLSGSNTLISHAHGSVQLNGVQWTSLPENGDVAVHTDYGNVVMQQGHGPTTRVLSPLPGAVDQVYSFALEEAAQKGTVMVTANGDETFSYFYLPTSGSFSGQDSFSLRITGESGPAWIAHVDVEVQPSSQLNQAKTFYGSLGHDDLTGGLHKDLIFGDTNGAILVRNLMGGDDVIDGGGSSDTIYGDGHVLAASSQGGDDIISGGDRGDRLFGDGFRLNNTSRGGDDDLKGGAGGDVLFGDARRVGFDAKAGDDRLDGGTGNDHLYGDGRDLMPGATRGRDTFVFYGAHGSDIVHDFEVGRDVLEFHNIDASTLSVDLRGANTLISHAQGSVQLKNVQWTALPQNGDVALHTSYGNIIMQQGGGPVSHLLMPLPASTDQIYSFALEKAARNGTVTIIDNGDGAFSYAYAPMSSSFAGKDSFSLQITDEGGDVQIASVDIDVQPSSQQGWAKTLYGSLGHDDLSGGQQADRIYGDTTEVSVATSLMGGNDVVAGGDGSDLLYGDGYILAGSSQGGDDTLSGNGGKDQLFGDGFRLNHNSRGGDDNLRGGADTDWLHGDARRVGSDAVGGDDRLDGGAGDDHLFGDGQQMLAGATGGRDTFVFDGAHGSDIVYDFEAGRDVLEFNNIDERTMSLSLSGANTILTHSEGSVQINNVHWAALDDVPYAV